MLDVVAPEEGGLDITDRDALLPPSAPSSPRSSSTRRRGRPSTRARRIPTAPYSVNSLGTRNIAEAARLVGAHVCYLSTDYVFDGTSPRPYLEWDDPNPLSAYGRSSSVASAAPRGAHHRAHSLGERRARGANMVKTVLRLAKAGGPLALRGRPAGKPDLRRDLAAGSSTSPSAGIPVSST